MGFVIRWPSSRGDGFSYLLFHDDGCFGWRVVDSASEFATKKDAKKILDEFRLDTAFRAPELNHGLRERLKRAKIVSTAKLVGVKPVPLNPRVLEYSTRRYHN